MNDSFPFAGLVSKDNLPAGPALTVWKSLPTTYLPLNKIYLTQDKLQIAQIFVESPTDLEHDVFPHVGLWKSKLWLYNGHHRVVKYALRGITHYSFRVFEL